MIQTLDRNSNIREIRKVRDYIWLIAMAALGGLISFIPFNHTVALAFQVVAAAVVLIGNYRRPVMMIVANIFLANLPIQLIGGFSKETQQYYYLSRTILCMMVVSFLFLDLVVARGVNRGKLNIWLTIFSFYAILTYSWALIRPYYDPGFLLMCLSYIFFPFFLRDEWDVKLVLIAQIVYAQIFSVLALPVIWGGEYFRGIINLDPNYASFTLVLSLVSSLVLYTRNGRSLSFFFKAILVLFSALNLVLLGVFASRTAFLALALVASVFIFLNFKSLKVLITSNIMIVSLMIILNKRGFFDTIFARMSEKDVLGGGGRVSIWTNLIYSIKSFGMSRLIFGNGYLTTGLFGKGVQAHNAYLSILIGFGIVGLILFLGYQVHSFLAIIGKRMTPYLLFVACLAVYCVALEPYIIPDGIIFFSIIGAIPKLAREDRDFGENY